MAVVAPATSASLRVSRPGAWEESVRASEIVRFVVCSLSCLAVVAGLAACDNNPTLNLNGTWTGRVTSPTAPPCNDDATVTFTHSGSTVTGEWVLSDGTVGDFEGTIVGGFVTGTLDVTTPRGCVGFGEFSGEVSNDVMHLSAPRISGTDPACYWCQDNVLTLWR